MECHPFNLWFEEDPSKKGVFWHGRTAWQLMDLRSKIGLQYDIITDLPPPEDNMYADMSALVRGEADMSIDYWGVNHQRSLLIDFSYPQGHSGVFIYSGRDDHYLAGNIVKGVFDDPSYGMAFLAVVLMVTVTWCIRQREGTRGAFSTTLLHMVGNSLNQPLNSALWPNRTTGQATMIFFSLYNMAICIMYSSVIISILNTIEEPKGIDTMSDLNRTENQHVRIFMKELSYVPGYMNSSKMLEGFEHRIDYINLPKENKGAYLNNILKSIHNGSHVYISSEGNFNAIICPVNKEVNKTVHRKEDFRSSR